jgi:hypothetical protein
MTASGVLFPLGSAEHEGRMGRFLVVAPGSTVVSTVAQSPSLEASLTGIARTLEAAEERLAAAAPSPHLAGAQLQELHEIRLLVAALMADAVTPPRPSPGSAQASLRSWPV